MNSCLSVVIATHNRADYLRNALEGLNKQSIPKIDYEVLVVDNASTDHTKSVVRDIQQSGLNVKYIYENEPSANKARNIGWQQATGRYIVYLDDDAVPVPDWLEKIREAFEKVTPVPGIVGGKVEPYWEKERPDWLHDRLLGGISVVNYSDEKIFLAQKLPFSVNMAFQKSLIEAYGGFDLALGRKGNKLLSGDETALAIRIRRAGYPIYYDPEIEVTHYIHASRLQQKWFLKRYYWQGYSEALMWSILDKPTIAMWMRRLFFWIYVFIRNLKQTSLLFRNTNDSYQFYRKCIAHFRLGYLVGMFNLRASNK